MKEMGWSWADLSGEPGGVPPYVRRFCWDFTCAEAVVAAQRAQRMKASLNAG
jgi:hypothetical protein